MRNAAVVVFLFLVASAFGQPVISPEIESEALRLKRAQDSVAAPAVALAADRTGVVVAWTMMDGEENDRISVARLTAAGHVMGAIRELPLSSQVGSGIDAAFPAIAAAPSGTGFTIAWLELSRDGRVARNAYARLDADLQPSDPETLPVRATDAPALSSTEGGTWIAAGGQVWQLDAAGTVIAQHAVGDGIGDMSVGPGGPLLAAASKVREKFTCRDEAGCTASGGPFNGYCFEHCRIYRDAYQLRLMALPRAGEVTYDFGSDARPAVEAGKDGLVAVWFHGAQNTGGEIVAVQLRPESIESWPAAAAPRILDTFGRDAGPTRPDIATDGERYVIVWRRRIAGGDHDVVGASLEPDGTVVTFSIATSTGDERDPAVLAVGKGKFLVGYEKVQNGERHVAGKFVSFCCGRRRAVS